MAYQLKMARVAVQTTCNALYQHTYYLNAEDAMKDNNTDEEEPVEPKAKRARKPVTKGDYKDYVYVLPSARTISDYKHLQASQVECDAAIALVDKSENLKVTLHYDTT